MSVFLFRFLQNIGDCLDGLLGIDSTGRVVRIVDDNDLYLWIQRCLQCFRIRLESVGFVRRNHDGLCTVVACPVGILYEVRSEYHLLVARIEYGLHDNVQGGSRTNGHDDVVHVKIRTVTLVQIVRYGLSGALIAGICHVAVNHVRIHLVVDVVDGFFYFFRWVKSRVAYAEIIYILFTVNFRHLLSFLEHRSDNGASGEERFHAFCNHVFSPYYYYLNTLTFGFPNKVILTQ